MLAFVYLIIVALLGDALCRRFFPYVSTPHRVATAFIAGLLVSTWWTYLAAFLFSGTSYPMLLGNLTFGITAIAAIILLRRLPAKNEPETSIDRETTSFQQADWIVTAIFIFVAIVMMYGTFAMNGGNIRIAHHQSSDFGSTASIMQSFALGHNFPTEYPHFTGDRIRYHFLFYFQAGNLEYLGLSPASSVNVLSILSLLSMLVLVMTLGAVLFASRVVGRIGAILFFFHGSLAIIPFYMKIGSVSAVWERLGTLRDFLSSGLPYRGEDWGVWSQVVYLNQRHLSSSIGILLIVLVFLAIRHRERAEIKAVEAKAEAETKGAAELTAAEEEEKVAASKRETENEIETDAELEISDPDPLVDDATASETASDAKQALETRTDIILEEKETSAQKDDDGLETAVEESEEELAEPDESDASSGAEPESDDAPESEAERESDHELPDAVAPAPKVDWVGRLAPFAFAGLLLGLMPMWNGAVFTAAAGVLALMFFLLPLRREMLAIAVASAVVALPQVIFLKTGLARPAEYSLWHWGYTIDDPTFYKVFYYLAFTFGFKWIFIALALALGSRLQRLMMIAFTALLFLATCFQFSEEVLANHKFFNVWLVLMNVPVAFGLVRLWDLIPGPGVIVGRLLAVILTFFIVVGGIIDVFPIKNSFWVEYRFQGDPLVEWVKANTDPRSIFLSYRYVNHGILVAGRRLFYGHPYYAWGAGYPVGERDAVYRKMFESRNIDEIFSLMKSNNISYVAFDNLVKNGDFVKNNNERLYQAYFPVVFTDTENKYDGLKIYAVPETLGEPDPTVTLDPTPTPSPVSMVSNAFKDTAASGTTQFSRPRGIAADRKGNFFVADTGNARIQKFDAEGNFMATLGKSGTADGEIKEPNGIAIDDAGNIYVTDAANQKLVKLDSTGNTLKEWKGPDPGFYGPRDIAFGPNKQLYIVDQGRTRIVKFDPATEAFTSWGTAGSGESQFHESTGITVGGGFVFVADLGNNRIQVFDLEGKFIRMWEVVPWERYVWNYPDAIFDDQTKRLYVTNGWKQEVLVFDINGNPIDAILKPVGEDAFNNPTALCSLEANKQRQILILNTAGTKVSKVELETKNERTK